MPPDAPEDSSAFTSFDRPIPGQALTNPPGLLPYDRPPQIVDPEEALDRLMRRLLDDRQALHMLSLMEAGIPIDLLVNGLVSSGMHEGKWSAPTAYLLVPPLTVLLVRMAQAAKVSYKLHSTDGQPERIPEMMMKVAKARVASAQVDDAQRAGKQTMKDVRGRTGKSQITNVRGFA